KPAVEDAFSNIDLKSTIAKSYCVAIALIDSLYKSVAVLMSACSSGVNTHLSPSGTATPLIERGFPGIASVPIKDIAGRINKSSEVACLMLTKAGLIPVKSVKSSSKITTALLGDAEKVIDLFLISNAAASSDIAFT